MKTLLLASALFAGLFGSLAAAPAPFPSPVPYHAFCRTLWLFGKPCAEVSTTLVAQIQAFNPLSGCPECQYSLVSATSTAIKANHASVDGLQAENITITLSPTTLLGGCRVSAQSASLGFTSLLDNGLNYCNLYTLLLETSSAVIMKTLLLASALFAGLFGSLAAAPAPFPSPVPYHAFCRTLWLFGKPCAEVSTTLVAQIQAFNPLSGCPECQYSLVSATSTAIKANHASVDGLQAENITITLSPTTLLGGCRVSAQSASLGFTSLLDNGLNYCNLYTLLLETSSAVIMKTLLMASALFAGLFGSLAAAPAPFPSPVPYHAFCRTLWLFGKPCAEVSTTLVAQIQAFNPLSGCPECQYSLVSATPASIKANHTSVDGLQAENITITLSPTTLISGCRVSAQSASLGFTSLLDNGLNYCNLYTLLLVALLKKPSFIANMRPLLLASALIAGLCGSLVASPVPVPYYAFCRTLWLSKMIHNHPYCPPFQLISAINDTIKAQHTTMGNLQVENIEFSLQTTILTGSCRVTAQSTSLAVSSHVDTGLNYCNLYDLLTASGLNLAPGFMEMTSEWSCLGYEFATCKT
ncbi:hypothetical protein GBF38_016667 [Nibea albiflora]|uniref:Uncharacterized protein n=1 Tax=Nibea albiflora TaxID=240163 RepID=A0ACB7FIH4_NIBAL|nr:hypothetical protein GBF38_016667 [Nibea albiflora]